MNELYMDADWAPVEEPVNPTACTDAHDYIRRCNRRERDAIHAAQRLFVVALGIFLWACLLAALI